MSGFEQFAGTFDLGGQGFLAGQGRSVLGGQDFVGQPLQGVFGDAGAMLGAEDQPDRGVFAGV